MALCVIMIPESQPAQAAFQECAPEMCLVSLLIKQRISLGSFVRVCCWKHNTVVTSCVQ